MRNSDGTLHILRDHIDMLLLVLGIPLAITGALLKTSLGSWYSATALFLGLTFITFGMLTKLGLFLAKLRSLAGIGTVMISLAIVSITLAVALFQFVDFEPLSAAPDRYRAIYRITCVRWNPLYGRLYSALAQTSLALFASGVAARLLSLVSA